MSMVTILIALASRAPITILDEPAAGLDVVMRERFYQLLLEDFAPDGADLPGLYSHHRGGRLRL